MSVLTLLIPHSLSPRLTGRDCSTFRYGCKARASKFSEKNLTYALMSEVIREGGIMIAIIVRYSTIPPHCESLTGRSSAAVRGPVSSLTTRISVTTAVFATAGMSVWTFLVAAFLALPKQLAVVYIGVGERNGVPVDENGGAFRSPNLRPPARTDESCACQTRRCRRRRRSSRSL